MSEQRDQKDKEDVRVRAGQPRKPYAAPQLTEYGHCEELTQGRTGRERERRSSRTTD